jgi:hypothetical protein
MSDRVRIVVYEIIENESETWVPLIL